MLTPFGQAERVPLVSTDCTRAEWPRREATTSISLLMPAVHYELLSVLTHRSACVGCEVSCTVVCSSIHRALRSTSSRSQALKLAPVRATQYRLRQK
jgi:hypothetical protein